MARHRSPQGRRAHLGPPLSAALATAGAGGAGSVPLPQSASPAWSTSSLPVRFVATAVAGTALAAAGQHMLVQAVPMASDGAAALRLGINELLGSGTAAPAASLDTAATIGVAAAAAPLVAEPISAVAPVSAEPVVVDAAGLVKAADLQLLAAEEAARAAEAARLAEEVRIVEAAEAAEVQRAEVAESAGGAVAAAGGGAVSGQFVDGRFTSAFGTRNGAAHQGVDIAAPIGTPVHVPLDGTVVDAGPASGFGLWVRVEHADGTVTTYGHVNEFFVAVGDQVSAGEVIAEVGNRGRSSGPHLHFEVDNATGQKINPRPWLADLGIAV